MCDKDHARAQLSNLALYNHCMERSLTRAYDATALDLLYSFVQLFQELLYLLF